MNVSFANALLAAVAAAVLATGCEAGFATGDDAFALTDQEKEDEKEVMCAAHPCETEVKETRKLVSTDVDECEEEDWDRSSSTTCDLENGTSTTTYTYTRYVRNHHTPKEFTESYNECEYTVTIWTVTETRDIPDGDACEDGDNGDDG